MFTAIWMFYFIYQISNSCVWCCVYDTGESSVEVNIEADSNDITEHPHDDSGRHTDRLYSCAHCEKSFNTYSSISLHMNVHSSKYKCTECGKCFISNRNLTVHRRSHSGEKPFECTVCSKRFSQSGHLVMHSRIHSGEKPCKCQLCQLVSIRIYKLTWESTRETNHTSVYCVTKVSLHPAVYSYINVTHTATDDLMTVVGVGSCLKVVVIWGNMFILTLVQSRTHVDTVQNVLHFITNSRHIYCSHTMKVLGSHVTFVRRNSPRMVTLTHIYFVIMKVCLHECLKCFHTASELKSHKFRHSDVKHFCCGKCG